MESEPLHGNECDFVFGNDCDLACWSLVMYREFTFVKFVFAWLLHGKE